MDYCFNKKETLLPSSFVHKGVLIPEVQPYLGLAVKVNDVDFKLNPKQEEMAFAWVRKLGTPYVKDLVFVRNYMSDFSKALGYAKRLKIDQIDFENVIKIVDLEREKKAAMTKEEKKLLAGQRKEIREALKEEYGHAIADGERIELGNYLVEPSSIFMGRGKHPLRGRWKEGAHKNEIILNLSPDAPRPDGNWKEITWQPDSLWVAKWDDRLSKKIKYIWLHDTAPIKQVREAQKFDKATELNSQIEKVRLYIKKGLLDDNPRRRKIATACYLIDALCLRVGDEKDPEEADTVGATTLRPEHLKLHDNGTSEFKFLGKDSVLWHKKINLPEHVITNLKELSHNARPSNNKNKKKHAVYDKPQLFPDVTSRNVNAFLSEAMQGLTAKVFRTHHATTVVRSSLEDSGVTAGDPEYLKWETTVRANMEAAILCNHTKQAPQNWSTRKVRFKEREKRAKERIVKLKERYKALTEELKKLRIEVREKKASTTDKEKLKKIKERYEKRILSKSNQIEKNKLMQIKAEYSLGKLKVQKSIALQNRTWNLGTSQKSYIDPRVFYDWGKKVDYDVIEKYYAQTLRRKFMWVKSEAEEQSTKAS
jgi:DNA topoisomerase I